MRTSYISPHPMPIMYPDTITLELKAKHFAGTFYNDRVNGVVCKAIREKDKSI